MAWKILLCIIGAVFGGVPAVYGAGKKVSWAAFALAGADVVVKAMSAASRPTETLKGVFDLFLAYNAQGYMLYLVGGAVSGFVLMSAGLAGLVLRVNYIRYRRADHEDPGAAARQRAVYCFTHGLLAYREEFKDEKPPETDKDRLLVFAATMLEDLEQQLASGVKDVHHARMLCKQMGGTLLALMFERKRKEFRIAVFEREGDVLVPHVRVGHASAPHSGDSLPVKGTTIGWVVTEGRPKLWALGDPGVPYLKKGTCSYKSFYAHPVPAEDLPKWAGVTLDYVRKNKKAFTPQRQEAVRLFARYVQVIYTQVRKEGSDEEQARDAAAS